MFKVVVVANPLFCAMFMLFYSPQGKKVYYHKIIIESASSKEIVSVKCITTSGPVYNVMMNGTNAAREQTQEQPQQTQQPQHHGLVRRDVLPAGFQEPE